MGKLENDQREFLQAEFFQLTLEATMQRGAVYQPNLTEQQRQPVHRTLRERLDALLPQYESTELAESTHLANIEQLAQDVTARHTEVLNGGRFRVGNAQKALNLYLKYLWCLGRIGRPPHCPFDYYVLHEIPGWKSRSWTAIDSIGMYAELVAAARVVAGTQSLAEWEIALYNTLGRGKTA